MKPTLTVSGYRGIWGDTLTPEIAREYVRAFAAFVGSTPSRGQLRAGVHKILVGRDGRESGPELMEIVIAELLSRGFDVVDLGMTPTPAVVFHVPGEQADGAVIVTASHNAIEYNGLKFVTSAGAFTTETEVATIEALRGATPATPALPGTRTDASQLFQKYLDVLLAHIDVEAIRARTFKVAVDPINSVGATTTPLLLDNLCASFTLINGNPDGKFGHAPEPLAQNLTALATLVRVAHADVGFAQDPDGDRLVLVDETGTILSEELTLALSARAVLAKTPGDIVINAVTSTICEDIAAQFGGKTWRSKVGEANVVKAMREHDAVVGGEGSGGVIWPKVNPARDSYVAMALVLECMAKEGKPLSEIVTTLPKYFMAKEKVARTGELAAIYDRLRAAFPGANEDATDGLRLDLPDRSWVNIRPSNTEPIIRIFAEAKTSEAAAELVRKAQSALLS